MRLLITLQKLVVVLALLMAASQSLFAQDRRAPAPTPTPPPEDIIRISSNLVLVDALVVDKDDKQVKGLRAEDFEVYQDGVRREITSFSYVDGAEKTVNVQQRRENGKRLTPPPVRLNSRIPGRVITFVIDDGNCLSTLEGTAIARDGVRKFIREQMRPDDKVAIYRTRGGSSLLQMYTSNKDVLLRQVNKVSWVPGRCGSAFEPARDKSTLKITGKGADSFESEEDKATAKAINEVERDNQVIGAMGVLGFVVDRLKTLPERKLVFFVSEGVNTPFGSRSYDALRALSDRASRASVVIYTLGAKGLTTPGFISAEDEVLPGIATGNDETIALKEGRIEEERALNEGMSYLAYSTGGRFLRNRNYLESSVGEVLEAETGYYLLGYEPESDTFEGKEYHRIEVRIKNPDLKVFSRKGFIGWDEAARKRRGPVSPVYEAIASPFAESVLDVKMTPLLAEVSQKESKLRVLFHISGDQLRFTDEPGGMKKLVLNVVVVALNEKGEVATEFNRAYPIRIPDRGVDAVVRSGLDYSTDINFDKPGIYSLRLAVRDEGSGSLGSAGDYIEIPKYSSKRFFIGSVVTTPIRPNETPRLPKPRALESGFAPVFDLSLPSIRKYKPGTALGYAFDVYNPALEAGKPRLASRVAVYRDGELVTSIPEMQFDADISKGTSRIEDYGFLRLDEGTPPGLYVLQITVIDKVSNKAASSWIDFEVID